MDEKILEELLDELLPSFEALEAQNGAVLQFLKDKGIATEEQLAPYLEQSRSASDVRWRAAHLRMKRLLISAMEKGEERPEGNSVAGQSTPPEPKNPMAAQKQEPQRDGSEHASTKVSGSKDKTAVEQGRNPIHENERIQKDAA